MKYKDQTVLGKGLYTIPEAARLARVSSAQLSRWVGGYQRAGVTYPALWQSDIPQSEDGVVSVISFSDLMECMVIAAFYAQGVQIQVVRKAIDIAKERFGISKPFSSERFQTDGKRIFADIKDLGDSDSGIIEVLTAQRAFREIVQPSFRNIDFHEQEAVRWWPLGKKLSIVVDPARSMGTPISQSSGVPAATLVDALHSENNESPTKAQYKGVAKLFDVSEVEVKDAYKFSQTYAA